MNKNLSSNEDTELDSQSSECLAAPAAGDGQFCPHSPKGKSMNLISVEQANKITENTISTIDEGVDRTLEELLDNMEPKVEMGEPMEEAERIKKALKVA